MPKIKKKHRFAQTPHKLEKKNQLGGGKTPPPPLFKPIRTDNQR
jgi:hypothetical protein